MTNSRWLQAISSAAAAAGAAGASAAASAKGAANGKLTPLAKVRRSRFDHQVQGV